MSRIDPSKALAWLCALMLCVVVWVGLFFLARAIL